WSRCPNGTATRCAPSSRGRPRAAPAARTGEKSPEKVPRAGRAEVNPGAGRLAAPTSFSEQGGALMPAVTMTCPGCRTPLQVPTPPQSGGVIRCPSCSGLFRLWGSGEAPPTPPTFRGGAPEPAREGSSVYRMGRSLAPQVEPEQTPPGRLDP